MLDKSVVKRIAVQCGILQNIQDVPEYVNLCVAIYNQGVKDERERLAKKFDEARQRVNQGGD